MKRVAIGVDIGGTSVKFGLVDEKGCLSEKEVLFTKNYPGRSKLFHAIANTILGLKKKASQKGMKVAGVGVGAPGPIDVERGKVYFFPNIPGWKDTPLKALLQKKIGLPVSVDNDANAMALAEYCFGAGRGCEHMIALTLGTGVGGGIVMGGKLFHGPAYSAAEIGHLVLNEEGHRCGCGNRGCLETYLGNGHFVREVRKRLAGGAVSVLSRWVQKDGVELTPKLVQDAARQGDRFAVKMWEETGVHLGMALVGLVNILNPERIVIGGGIALGGEMIFRPVRQTIAKKAFPIAARSVKVVPAKLGADSGLVGAAALALQRS